MKRAVGFTLVEVMVVLAILIIVAVIAVPNLLRSRMSAAEAAAAAAVRTIATAQVAFKTSGFVDADGNGEGDYGTLAQLGNPGGTGGLAPFIDLVLASGNKQGYVYTVNVTLGSAGAPPSYTCTAIPVSPRWSGVRAFYVDDTAIIRYTSDGSVPNAASPPLN